MRHLRCPNRIGPPYFVESAGAVMYVDQDCRLYGCQAVRVLFELPEAFRLSKETVRESRWIPVLRAVRQPTIAMLGKF